MDSFNDYLNINTPENIAFDYEVVGIGSRFLAAFIDTLLIIVLQIIVNLTLFFLANLIFDNISDDFSVIAWGVAIVGLVSFAILWGYYIFFEMIWNGQSPGKRWTGVRVIRADGAPITLADSVIRNLVRLVDFLPLYYGVGVVAMFINSQSRRLGDLAAGTLVVRDKTTITLESLAAKSDKAAGYRLPPSQAIDLPVERLNSRDLRMAEEFVRRRDELTNRAALAQHLAQRLLSQMELPERAMTSREAEDVIGSIVQASRSRNSASSGDSA